MSMQSLKIDHFRGFNIKGGDLQHWSAILEEWLLLLERFSRVRGGGSSPFGYGERANVSLLAGAAWRCRYIATTEFSHPRRHKGPRRHKSVARWGRADLEIASESGSDIVEAKFQWVSLTSNDIKRKVRRVVERARDDAVRSHRQEQFTNALGIAFIGMHIDGRAAKQMKKLIPESVGAVLEENYALTAWCFPVHERVVQTPEGNYTPGVIMVGVAIE